MSVKLIFKIKLTITKFSLNILILVSQ